MISSSVSIRVCVLCRHVCVFRTGAMLVCESVAVAASSVFYNITVESLAFVNDDASDYSLASQVTDAIFVPETTACLYL